MIRVTRLDDSEFILNSDLIEHVDATPDTVISLVSGKKWIVRESMEEVVRRVIAYRRSIAAPLPRAPAR